MKRVIFLAVIAGLVAWFVGGQFISSRPEPVVGPRIIIDELPDTNNTPKRGRN